MKTIVPINIVTCPLWDARPPAGTIDIVPKSIRMIFHHTAGHHPELDNPLDESYDESVKYAQNIQDYHMDHNGWIDSGHNFLVCRNGVILQGRWHTVWAIQHGQMVRSAHCPGQNAQIGIEHEHKGFEKMTAIQKESSATLMAWIAGHYERDTVLPLKPHSAYYPTECPSNLVDDMAGIRARAGDILRKYQAAT